MVILSDKIIYNKIKQVLSYIPDDFVIEKHVRLRISEMIISSGESIISHESHGPIRMWERGFHREELGHRNVVTNER